MIVERGLGLMGLVFHPDNRATQKKPTEIVFVLVSNNRSGQVKALPLGYASKLEEGTGRIVKPASKKDIPDAVCDAKPSLDSLCAMMV